MMNNLSSRFCVLVSFFLAGIQFLNAQTLTDGPIELQVRLKDVNIGYNETDASLLGVGFGPDEPVVKVWAQDNSGVSGLGWQGGQCNTFSMGTGSSQGGLPGVTPAIGQTLFTYTYPTATVPQFLIYGFMLTKTTTHLINYKDFARMEQTVIIPPLTWVKMQRNGWGLPIFGVRLRFNEGDR